MRDDGVINEIIPITSTSIASICMQLLSILMGLGIFVARISASTPIVYIAQVTQINSSKSYQDTIP